MQVIAFILFWMSFLVTALDAPLWVIISLTLIINTALVLALRRIK